MRRDNPLPIVLIVGMVIGAGLAYLWAGRDSGPRPRAAGAAEVSFTPREDCTGRVVAVLAAARREVLVQAYSFTSPPIARALEAAKGRGVRVRIIVDDSQLTERSTQADDVRRAGLDVWVDDPPGIAHNKVMVVDGETVITGSFNFTVSAQTRNAENLFVLRDATLAARYAANWERRRAVSVPYDDAVAARAANDNRPRAANDNAPGDERGARARERRRETKAREGLL